MPVVESVRGLIERRLPAWPKQPRLVAGEEDKFRAFKLARAALAASGTVTLELAVAGTPMVVAYKVDPVMVPVLRRLIKTPTIVLPNLVLDEKAFPEFHPGDLHVRQSPMRSRRCSTKAPGADNGSWRRWRAFRSACSCRGHAERGGRATSCSTTPRRAAAGRTRSSWDGTGELQPGTSPGKTAPRGIFQRAFPGFLPISIRALIGDDTSSSERTCQRRNAWWAGFRRCPCWETEP